MQDDRIQEKLQRTLVLSVFKSFWASKESAIFPNIIYCRNIIPGPGRFGTSRNPVNNFTVAIQGIHYYLKNRPKLIIIGSSARVAPWYAHLKKIGFLSEAKLVALGQNYLSDRQVEQFEMIIVHSTREIDSHKNKIQEKFKFIHLPADGNFESLNIENGEYIFSGGGAGRDFISLIRAIEGTGLETKIITFSQKSLGFSEKIPDNCKIKWRLPRQEFLQYMAKSKFVVVPLLKGNYPHGQTTVVQALRLGKAVVSTKAASVEDYITQNIEGILIEPGNVFDYRDAIKLMAYDQSFRENCERNARIKAKKLTYTYFKNRLLEVVNEII